MNSEVSIFLVCVILIVLPLMSSIARRKRFEGSMKRYYDEAKVNSKKKNQR